MIFRYSSEASVILAFFSRVTNRNCFYSEGFNLQLVNLNLPPIVCPCHREVVSPLYPTPTQPMDQPLDKPSIACHTHVAWLFLVCQSNFGPRHDTTQSYRLNPVNHFWIEGLEKKCRTESPKSSRCYSNKRRPFRLWNSDCKAANTHESHLHQSRDICQTNQTSSNLWSVYRKLVFDHFQ